MSERDNECMRLCIALATAEKLFEVSGMAFFDAGGVRLMLTAPSSAEFDHANSVLYFDVADVQATYESLSARGVKFDDEPHLVGRTGTHEVWMAFCRDPEKNPIAISEMRANPS